MGKVRQSWTIKKKKNNVWTFWGDFFLFFSFFFLTFRGFLIDFWTFFEKIHGFLDIFTFWIIANLTFGFLGILTIKLLGLWCETYPWSGSVR